MSTTITNTFPVILLQGEDRVRQQELIAEVEQARFADVTTKAPARQGDAVQQSEEFAAAVRAYGKFRTGAIRRAIHVELQTIGRTAYGALIKKHPAREIEQTVTRPDGSTVVEKELHPDDAEYRFNRDTMGEELVPECVRSVTSPTPENVPDVNTPSKLAAWLDSLPKWAWTLLYDRAVELQEEGQMDPKVDLSSLLDQTFDAT